MGKERSVGLLIFAQLMGWKFGKPSELGGTLCIDLLDIKLGKV